MIQLCGLIGILSEPIIKVNQSRLLASSLITVTLMFEKYRYIDFT